MNGRSIQQAAGKIRSTRAMVWGLTLAAALPALPIVAASPGNAAIIVQNIPISQSLGDFTPFDINALPFNPATGVLASVMVEIIGTYTPITATDLTSVPPTTATLTSRLFVFPTIAGPTTNIPLGSQTVPVVGTFPNSAGISTGAATPVDELVNLLPLSSFESSIAGPQLLVEYGFRTSTTTSAFGSSGSDLTTFAGNAVLTYTYNVPEPATAALLAPALLGLAWRRRRG